MVKCPKCGAEIEYLYGYCREEARYIVDLDSKGKFASRYDQMTDSGQFDWTDFECPLCREPVTDSPLEAEELLKGFAV